MRGMLQEFVATSAQKLHTCNSLVPGDSYIFSHATSPNVGCKPVHIPESTSILPSSCAKVLLRCLFEADPYAFALRIVFVSTVSEH